MAEGSEAERLILGSDLLKAVKSIAGLDCCRQPTEPCSPACKIVWRVWIFIVALQLYVCTMLNNVWLLATFIPLGSNSDFFVAEKLSKMLLLTSSLVPVVFVLLNVAGMFLSFWAFMFAVRPNKGSTRAVMVYKCLQGLVSLATLILLIIEVFYCFDQWPDEKYVSKVEQSMKSEVRLQNPERADSISKAWNDTQTVFECCGVRSFEDWFELPKSQANRSRHHGHGVKTLPGTCCNDNNAYCTDPETWRRDGCLAPQISMLKFYAVGSAISLLLLYGTLAELRRSITTFFTKFPAQPENDDGDNDKTGTGVKKSVENPPEKPRKRSHPPHELATKHKAKIEPKRSHPPPPPQELSTKKRVQSDPKPVTPEYVFNPKLPPPRKFSDSQVTRDPAKLPPRPYAQQEETLTLPSGGKLLVKTVSDPGIRRTSSQASYKDGYPPRRVSSATPTQAQLQERAKYGLGGGGFD